MSRQNDVKLDLKKIQSLLIYIKYELFSWRNIRSQVCVLLLLSYISITRENCNFIKKRTRHRCFPVNFAKFFKNTFCLEHLRKAASETFTENSLGNSVRNEQLHVI